MLTFAPSNICQSDHMAYLSLLASYAYAFTTILGNN